MRQKAMLPAARETSMAFLWAKTRGLNRNHNRK
jgi:hypothetical protein